MNRIDVDPGDLGTAAARLDEVAQALLALRGQALAVGGADTGRPDSRSAVAVTVDRLLSDLATSVRVTRAHADDLRSAVATYETVESRAVRAR